MHVHVGHAASATELQQGDHTADRAAATGQRNFNLSDPLAHPLGQQRLIGHPVAVKAPGAMPLWLCELLNQNEIYPTSFSKYGMCYRNYIYPQLRQTEKGLHVYA